MEFLQVDTPEGRGTLVGRTVEGGILVALRREKKDVSKEKGLHYNKLFSHQELLEACICPDCWQEVDEENCEDGSITCIVCEKMHKKNEEEGEEEEKTG